MPESLVFTCARILFLVSLLYVALLDPFDPYLNFQFLLILYIYMCTTAMWVGKAAMQTVIAAAAMGAHKVHQLCEVGKQPCKQ